MVIQEVNHIHSNSFDTISMNRQKVILRDKNGFDPTLIDFPKTEHYFFFLLSFLILFFIFNLLKQLISLCLSFERKYSSVIFHQIYDI